MYQYGGFELTIKEDPAIEAIIRELALEADDAESWDESLEYIAGKYTVDEYENEIDLDSFEDLFTNICKQISATISGISYEGYSHYSSESGYDEYHLISCDGQKITEKVIRGDGITLDEEFDEDDADDIEENVYDV